MASSVILLSWVYASIGHASGGRSFHHEAGDDGLVTTLLVGLVARGVAPQTLPPSQWLEEAPEYLDDRMDVWFAQAKKLHTGQGETACISCHTAVPYALSRPALRRAMHVATATPRAAAARGRHPTRGDLRRHQPFYDFNEAKKTESRGTEAVINALVLASADAEQNRREPTEPTRRALRRLWETQRPTGRGTGSISGSSRSRAPTPRTTAPRSRRWPSARSRLRHKPRHRRDRRPRQAARLFEGAARGAKPAQPGGALAGVDPG